MKSFSILSVTAFGALLAYYLVVKIQKYIIASRITRKHGCRPPPAYKQRESIIGLGYFQNRMKQYAANTMHANGLARFDELGSTYSAVTLGHYFLQTRDPENIKAILSTQFKDFGVGRRKDVLGQLLGDGIFTSDGTMWEHSRALIRPAFAKSLVANLGGFEAHIRCLIQAMPADGTTFDLQRLFFMLTLDTATEYLFGESANTLGADEDSEGTQFGVAFDAAQVQVTEKDHLGALGIFYNGKMLAGNCKTVQQYVEKFVKKCLDYRKELDQGCVKNEKEERYVFLNELAKATQDPTQLRDELLNMLLAGRDTTAGLLGHVWFYLSRRPDVWQKLKAEVDTLGGAPPNYDTLRNLKYLRFLLNETLRLHPALPTNARFSNKPTFLPRGGGPSGTDPIYVPGDTAVGYSVYAMHRNPAVFGPNVKELNPDRWEGLKVGWEYLPFNGGPRICVGQQFALTEAGYSTVRLVQELMAMGLEFEYRGEGYIEAYTLTNKVGGGVPVALVPKK